MIFDSHGLPKDTGASDFQDSSRLAGMMAIISHPKTPSLSYYLDLSTDDPKYVRHPYERVYDFSRDQALPLMAGFYFQGKHFLSNKDFVDGRDIFTPSHTGHIRRCRLEKPNLLQKIWFIFEIYFSAKFQPMKEPNQIIAMMAVAGPFYMKIWTKNNKKWRESIHEYWSGWRGEKELADSLILFIEKMS